MQYQKYFWMPLNNHEDFYRKKMKRQHDVGKCRMRRNEEAP